MRTRLGSLVAAVATVLSTVGVLLVTTGTAYAVNPGWEPDPNAIGNIQFYNSTGATVASGSTNDSPVAAYAIGSHLGRTGDSKATLFLCTPQVGVDPSLWSCDQLTTSTDYPTTNASAPALIKNSNLPDVTGASGDETVAQENASFPNNLTTAGYQNLYQFRIYTSGPGQAQGPTYDRADIQVNTGTHAWTQVFPAIQTTTTTATVNKTSPQPAGTTLVLTATVTNNATGTVQFFDGATAIGSALTLPGSASNNKVTLSQVPATGTRSYKAVYTPALVNGFTGSTSSTVSFVTQAASADISATIAGPMSVAHNANATYTVTGMNHGPDGSQGTIGVLLVPLDATVVTKPSNCVVGQAQVGPSQMKYVGCGFGSLANGASANFQATVSFANTGAHKVYGYSKSNTPDPTTSNNAAPKTTTVT